MTEHYDAIPDLAALLMAAVGGRHDAIGYGERIASRIGIGYGDSSLEAETVLRRVFDPVLDREQLGTVLAALEDAADYRREHRDGDCTDCEAAPGLCGDHEADEAVASVYGLLHEELQEHQGGPR